MSEVDARPPPNRGRSSYRGGRGGFGRGGPRGGSRKPANGSINDTTTTEQESLEDQGELGEMKKKYSSELVMLRELFPDWTDVDLVFALQETDGDVPATVDHITQGSVSQFAEVKSSKDRARSKVKEATPAAGTADKIGTRGGRGRGGLESRGSRGRGSDRGRGGFRGARGGHATTNGTSKESTGASVPTTESTAWDDTTNATTAEGGWETTATDSSKAAANDGQSARSSAVAPDRAPAAAIEASRSSAIPENGAKKSWASMFAKPAPTPAPKTPSQAATPAEPAALTQSADDHLIADNTAPEPENVTEAQPAELSTAMPVDALTEEQTMAAAEGEGLAITPSKDPLTEENVEHLPDESHGPATLTVASTTGSMDPRNITPLPGQQAPIGRPPLGGYATSASRAAGVLGRSASYQRRVQEQQEAVVMPGHNALDRAAVQFGSMGLNGEPGEDVDEEREDPETRQAPQHSPPSQPRTSLPPAPRQTAIAQEQVLPESLLTPKQAPGLPPATQMNQQQMQQMQEPQMASHSMANDQSQHLPQAYSQYARYAQSGMQQPDSAMQQQKPYDPFSHQTQPSQFEQQYGSHAQQPQQPQQSQAGFGGLSSAPGDVSSYYTAEQQRTAYNNYYGTGYGPQDVRSQLSQSQQDTGLAQQRSASGFGTAPGESAYPSHAQQQVSIPSSLLELNEALNNCNNEGERQFLLKEIQRVVTSQPPQSQPQQKPQQSSLWGLQTQAKRDDLASRLGPGITLLKNLPPHDPAQLSDVTNIPPPLSPPIYSFIPSISNSNPKQAQQSRYADATNSGNNTPNPVMGAPGQQTPHQPSQHQQAPGGHQQQSTYGAHGYPYGHPYYASPYQQSYQQHQYPGYGGGQRGYGGGMYGQSQQQHYGMGPQSSYDQQQHSASPANSGAFGQNQQTSMRSASGMSGLGGLDDYGRSSAQPQTTAFGGMSDAFTRSTSGFGGQGGYGQQLQGMSSADESLKPYGETKGGPSPRPGSAVNAVGTAPQQQQSGYPGFPGQSQYGALGGLGGQHTQSGQQPQQYGSYGAGGFGQTYGGGGYSRGGWGANYGGGH